MHEFPPNVNWRWTTLLATVLGYIICDDFTAKEQIAIGNWILQIGQTSLTNATYQDLLEYRILGDEKINLNSRSFKQGGSPFINPKPPYNFEQFYEVFKSEITEEELANLQKAIQRINAELEKLREEVEKSS